MRVQERRQGFYDQNLEIMPWEEKQTLLERKLRQTVALAFARAPAVRAKLEAAGVGAGDIRSIADLQRVPVTPKAKMRELQAADPPFGGLLAVHPSELKRIFASPGPIFDPEGREPDFWRLQPVFYNAGLRPGDRVLNTLSYHLTPGGLMCDEALHALGCTVIPGGVGNSDTQIQLLRELQINAYVGVPSFLLSLIRKVEEEGGDFRRDFNLEIAVTAGEMLTTSVRRTLQVDHHVITRQFYATADVGAIAYECAEANGMHFADHRLIEIVDPETGAQLGPDQPGEVVVTLLDNPVYPLVRFGTGDLSFYEDGPCPCGRTSPRLMKLLGRVDQVTKVRGMFIHPSQVDEVTGAFPEILLGQAVVEREGDYDRLTYRAVLRASPISPEGFAAAVADKLRSVLKLRAEVRFVEETEIGEPQKRILDLRRWD